MIGRAKLLKEIDNLPPKYFGEVIDFVGYLQQKEKNQNDGTVDMETMLLSEASLSKDWDTPEEDKAWADL
jgi:hypothetical protein